MPLRDKSGRFISSKKITKAPKIQKVKTHYALVVDASGSMGGYQQQAVTAFNKQLDTIKQAAKDNNEDATVSVFTFEGHTVASVVTGVTPENAPALVAGLNYRIGDTTPLWQAVNTAFNALKALPKGKKTAYVILTVTDGQENSSEAGSQERVRQAIANNKDNFTFAFAGPLGSKEAIMRQVGALPGNIMEWEGSAVGAVHMGGQTASATYGSSVMRSTTGATSSNAGQGVYFVQTDASSIKAKDLKALADLQNVCKVWQVSKEENIKDFVESKKQAFVLGAGYYQLMKPEKVQATKQVLIVEKGKDAIYGGKEARDLIGLPEGQDAKVEPGNHAKFDIFVQSTSHNRILPRGTKLIYRTDHTVDSKHTWVDPTKVAVSKP